MSKFEKLEELFNSMADIMYEEYLASNAVYETHLQSLLDVVRKDVEAYEQTGILPPRCFDNIKIAEAECEEGGPPKETTMAVQGTSVKENNSDLANIQPKTTRRTRLTSIKTAPEITKVVDKPRIKIERTTADFNNYRTQTVLQLDAQKIKREAEEMPPPSALPPMKRTRTRKASTVSSSSSNVDMGGLVVKKELMDVQRKRTERESDVVVQASNVLNITVVDSDEEVETVNVRPVRKCTKARQLANTNSTISDDSENDAKRPEVEGSARSTRIRNRIAKLGMGLNTENDQMALNKTVIVQKGNIHGTPAKVPENSDIHAKRQQQEASGKSTHTRTRNAIKKDADQEPDNSRTYLNKTLVLEKPDNLNLTVVISKTMSKKPHANLENQLMTDDEDIIENSVKEPRLKRKKQIFSPYAESPVKKRVAAFEKLGSEAQAGSTSHTTRAKTKKLVENPSSEEENISPIGGENNQKSGIPKLRSTPIFESRILLNPSSVDRNQNPPGLKTKSALKSQAEFRERELKRKQKETEATLKKDALLNAQIEDKRRRNEERQLRAQQQRDAREKEKQQLLETAERAKQDKLKATLAEKDEKLLKQREEANKKRLLVIKKAALQKEQKKLVEDANKQGENHQPVKGTPPLLPTPDCYDSDDSTKDIKQIVKPVWQNSRTLYTIQKNISFIPQIKRKLFSCGPQYPDVHLIFPGCKPVKRNSSVIWDTSNVSRLVSMIEEESD